MNEVTQSIIVIGGVVYFTIGFGTYAVTGSDQYTSENMDNTWVKKYHSWFLTTPNGVIPMIFVAGLFWPVHMILLYTGKKQS